MFVVKWAQRRLRLDPWNLLATVSCPHPENYRKLLLQPWPGTHGARSKWTSLVHWCPESYIIYISPHIRWMSSYDEEFCQNFVCSRSAEEMPVTTCLILINWVFLSLGLCSSIAFFQTSKVSLDLYLANRLPVAQSGRYIKTQRVAACLNSAAYCKVSNSCIGRQWWQWPF